MDRGEETRRSIGEVAARSKEISKEEGSLSIDYQIERNTRTTRRSRINRDTEVTSITSCQVRKAQLRGKRKKKKKKKGKEGKGSQRHCREGWYFRARFLFQFF
jgi:hypothetical protein